MSTSSVLTRNVAVVKTNTLYKRLFVGPWHESLPRDLENKRGECAKKVLGRALSRTLHTATRTK